MTAPVAELRYLTRATRNSAENAQLDAQPAAGQIPRKHLSGKELRAQLRAQPERNQAIEAVATVAQVVARQEHPAGRPDGAHPAHISPTQCDFGARYRWLIVEADGTRREICTLPEMTRGELRPCYPGAQLRPLPDSAAEAAAILRTKQPAIH